MAGRFALFLLLLCAGACSYGGGYTFDPDYNRIAKNTTVVNHSANYVTYEYKNIRVDELAAVAAMYCRDQGGKDASLYDITLHNNNSRRVTFVCENPR